MCRYGDVFAVEAGPFKTVCVCDVEILRETLNKGGFEIESLSMRPFLRVMGPPWVAIQ